MPTLYWKSHGFRPSMSRAHRNARLRLIVCRRLTPSQFTPERSMIRPKTSFSQPTPRPSQKWITGFRLPFRGTLLIPLCRCGTTASHPCHRLPPSPSLIFNPQPAPLGAPFLVEVPARAIPRAFSTSPCPSSPVQTPIPPFHYRTRTWAHRLTVNPPPRSPCPFLSISILALLRKLSALRLHSS